MTKRTVSENSKPPDERSFGGPSGSLGTSGSISASQALPVLRRLDKFGQAGFPRFDALGAQDAPDHLVTVARWLCLKERPGALVLAEPGLLVRAERGGFRLLVGVDPGLCLAPMREGFQASILHPAFA